jgi:hypothetical protein
VPRLSSKPHATHTPWVDYAAARAGLATPPALSLTVPASTYEPPKVAAAVAAAPPKGGLAAHVRALGLPGTPELAATVSKDLSFPHPYKEEIAALDYNQARAGICRYFVTCMVY